ncbi:MAG: hypothetical protein O2816_09560, partial [Planctomycetota bacterium]|nr:hypothetical protein [Planctomycetota bacterium]
MESIVLERLLDLSRGLDRAGGPAHRARETAAAGAELLPGRGLSVHLTTAEGEVTAHVGPEMSADLLRLRLGVGPTPLGELVIDQEDLSSHDRRLCRELAATLTAAEEQAAQHMGELTTLHSALAYAVGVALDEVGHRPADLLERALLARQVGACLRPDDQAWLEALERDAIVFDLGRAQVPAELRGRVDLTQAEQALVEERTAAAANTLEALGLHAAAQAAGDGGGSGGGSGGD